MFIHQKILHSICRHLQSLSCGQPGSTPSCPGPVPGTPGQETQRGEHGTVSATVCSKYQCRALKRYRYRTTARLGQREPLQPPDLCLKFADMLHVSGVGQRKRPFIRLGQATFLYSLIIYFISYQNFHFDTSSS